VKGEGDGVHEESDGGGRGHATAFGGAQMWREGGGWAAAVILSHAAHNECRESVLAK